jgi:hypothetical protein
MFLVLRRGCPLIQYHLDNPSECPHKIGTISIMTTNKSSFFQIARATSTIEVEGLGDVHCRELSAGSVSALQKEGNSEMDILAQVLISGVVDDNGKPMFTQADKSKLLDMTLSPLTAISEEIMKLTGLTDGGAGDESPNE